MAKLSISIYCGDTVTHYRGFGPRNGNNKPEYSRVAPPKPSPFNLSRPFGEADVRSSGLGVGSGIKNSPTDKGTGPRPQRKCWICQSPNHVQSACPEKGQRNNQGGRFSVPSAQVKACAVAEPAYLGHTVVADEEVAVMNVQVNHCVVEFFGEFSTSLKNNSELANDFKVKGPVTLKLGTHVPKQNSPAEPVIGSENRNSEFDNSSSRIGDSMLDGANCTNSVRTSPLTHCHVYVESSGPIRCLVDSGSEFSIAKRSMVDKIKPCANSVG